MADTLNGQLLDPLQGFRFIVKLPFISSTTDAIGFSKVSGLEEEIEIGEHRDGNEKTTNRKFPGLSTYPNVSLEKGLDPSGVLLIWLKAISNIDGQNTETSPMGLRTNAGIPTGGNAKTVLAQSQVNRIVENFQPSAGNGVVQSNIKKDIDIIVHGYEGQAVRGWRLKEAFPVKVSVGDLDASSSDIVIETLELAHEGLVII